MLSAIGTRGVRRKATMVVDGAIHGELFLAEVCYRHNHREEDLAPLITKLMKRVQREDAERILVQIR